MQVSSVESKAMADDLDRTHTTVTPRSGTILSELLDMSVVSSPLDDTPDAPAVMSSMYVTNRKALIKDLTSRLVNDLGYIRNKIIPQITHFRDKLDTRLTAIRSVSPTKDLLLEFWYTPEIIRNATFLEVISSFDRDRTVVSSRLTLPTLTDDQQVLERLVLGGGDIDEDINTWTKTLPEGYLVDTYNKYFTFVSPTNPDITRLSQGLTLADMNDVLLITLVARNLRRSPLDNAEQYPNYYRALGEMVKYSARLLSALIHNWNRRMEHGSLVIHKSPTRLLLVRDIFTQFMEKSNDIDILYGYMVSDKTFTGLTPILSNKELFLKNLKSYIAHKQVSQKHDFLRIAALATEVTFNECFIELKKVLPPEYNDEQVIKDSVRTYLQKQVTHEMYNNTDDMARYIIAKLVFPFTYAYEFTGDMITIDRDNPGLDPSVTAGLATIKLVNSFLVGQTDITRAKS